MRGGGVLAGQDRRRQRCDVAGVVGKAAILCGLNCGDGVAFANAGRDHLIGFADSSLGQSGAQAQIADFGWRLDRADPVYQQSASTNRASAARRSAAHGPWANSNRPRARRRSGRCPTPGDDPAADPIHGMAVGLLHVVFGKPTFSGFIQAVSLPPAASMSRPTQTGSPSGGRARLAAYRTTSRRRRSYNAGWRRH